MTNSIGRNGARPGAIPDIIYPAIAWEEHEYARLQARLDLFDDFLVLSKYQHGQLTVQYPVDPTEVAAALSSLNLNSGLLPRECLFWGRVKGQDRLGIYVPPQCWLVSVRDEAQTWRVPLPGLVFVGHDYSYSVWAVTQRPVDQRTELYLAPCPNVHPDGVCRGSAPFPQAGPTTMWQAVDIFFSSKFNRDLANHKSKAYPDSVLDQWRALDQAGAESYPLTDLVKTKLTLGRLLDV